MTNKQGNWTAVRDSTFLAYVRYEEKNKDTLIRQRANVGASIINHAIGR